MGVGRLQAICDELTGHGLPDTMPAALIQWGTLPKQRHVKGTLANIKARVDEAALSSPAIIVTIPNRVFLLNIRSNIVSLLSVCRRL